MSIGIKEGRNRERGSTVEQGADEELEQLERTVGRWLEEYDVEYPSESQMMKTIDALRPYVPARLGPKQTFVGHMTAMLRRSIREVLYFSPWFWLFNSLFVLLGLVAVFAAEQNPYVVVMLLAPLPTMIGMIEVWKSRHAGMAELELSLKYSLQEIMLSKMVVVGGYNLAINLLATGLVSAVIPDVWMWKLMLYWVVPFTGITAAAYLAVGQFRHKYGIVTSLAGWLAFGSFMGLPHVREKLESIPWPVPVLAAFIFAILAVVGMIRLSRKGVGYEFTD